MFGHKLSSIPNQNYRVDSHPTIEQLSEMIEKARGMSGIKHNYLWEVAKDYKKFTLSLHCKENSGEEIDWWLHEENLVGTKMLWFHKTKDIAVIYPHLLSAVGAKHPLEETAEEKAQAEKEKEKPTSLGERFKRSSSSADLMQAPSHEEEMAAAAAAAPQDAGQASMIRLMTGSLKLRPIAWLLQTAAQSELTGELRVEGDRNRVVIIQFGLGRPVHAATANKVGTEAVLELFCWQDGLSSFTEGKQPETASVQDSTDEILKQGSKLLENLGYLSKHGMDEYSVLSRPPIGLSEEQLEERLKDGIDYGFKIQRAFYRALDGQLSLRDVGDQISLDTSRLIAIAVNFLRLGLILTPDGRSLRQVAPSGAVEAFANAQLQAQSGAQQALKPPAGFFGGGGFGAEASAPPSAGSAGETPATPPASAPTAAPLITPPGFGSGAPAGSGTPPGFGAGAGGSPTPPAGVPIPPVSGPSAFGVSAEMPVPTGAHNSGIGNSGPQQPFVDQLQVPRPTQEMSGRQTALSSPSLSGAMPLSSSGVVSQQPLLAQPPDREFFEVGVPSGVLPFEESSVKAVVSSLTNKQTGAFTYPAFQFLLEREFAKAFRFSSEFSLLVFCIRLGGGNTDNPTPASAAIPMASLALATQAIMQIKRDVDIFGHVGDKAFGLVLPGVGTNQSHALVDRIVADLPKLAPKLGGYWPILHFGIAGVPQDARDLPSLMKAAQEAMLHAANKNYTRIRSADMQS
jgi:hypothetical protein